MKKQFGLLIVNLGSPRSPTIPAISDFLREFLMDPYVIDIPFIPRWLLVNGIIAPFRPKSVVKKYKTIWTKMGSPLIVETVNFKNKLEKKLSLLSNYEFTVEIGMRYGAPSIKQALESFHERDIKDILVLQMYPQEAFSTTFSNEDLIGQISKQLSLNVSYIPAYFDNPGFIQSLAETVQETLQNRNWDHLIMSYHGIPIRQTAKQSKNPKCGTPGCCDDFLIKNCYKAQCEQTSRLLAQKLGLNSKQYTVSYQSRLDDKWIKPFTDHLIQELPAKGIKNLAIISPSFVIDCLETLEELQVQEKERFISAGGHMYTYIPCLNAREGWVNSVFGMIQNFISSRHQNTQANQTL